MTTENWNKIGQIVDSMIDADTYKQILIDHLGDKCKFTGKNKDKIAITDPNIQQTLGFTTNTCVFVEQMMGGEKQEDGSYVGGLNTLILTGTDQITQYGNAKKNAAGRVGLGATNLMYFTTYNHDEKEYVNAVKEVINYANLSEMDLLRLMQEHGIDDELIEELAEELDIDEIPEEVSANALMENESQEFIAMKDEDCTSLLGKIQSQIEPSLYVYQLYQNDFIDFDEYIRVQDDIVDKANNIDEIDITLKLSAVLPLKLLDNNVKLTKHDTCGYVLTQMLDFEGKESQNVDFVTICEKSKVKEPHKYGITQILSNSELSPNEILLNCFQKTNNNGLAQSQATDTTSSSNSSADKSIKTEDTLGLSNDERKIFDNAVAFCRAQNPFFMPTMYVNKTLANNIRNFQNQLAKETLQSRQRLLKSVIHNLNNQPLYAFDKRFYQSIPQNGKIGRNLESKTRKIENIFVKDMLYKKNKTQKFTEWLIKKGSQKVTAHLLEITKMYQKNFSSALLDLKNKAQKITQKVSESINLKN